MAPTIPTFHVSSLPVQTNTLANGKARKNPVDLETDCALKQMVQYKCNVAKAEKTGGKPTILCKPVVRFYRMCDGFSVETTAWETWRAREGAKGGAAAAV